MSHGPANLGLLLDPRDTLFLGRTAVSPLHPDYKVYYLDEAKQDWILAPLGFLSDSLSDHSFSK